MNIATTCGVEKLPKDRTTDEINDPEERSIEHRRAVTVVLTILNTIIVPCLTVIAVSSQQGLLYLFTTPNEVMTSYTFQECLGYEFLFVALSSSEVESTSAFCLETSTLTQWISYSPPFSYRYASAYALLQAYTPVFAYMFLLSGFVIPFYIILLWWVSQRLSPESKYFMTITNALPTLLQPLDLIATKKSLLPKLFEWFSLFYRKL